MSSSPYSPIQNTSKTLSFFNPSPSPQKSPQKPLVNSAPASLAARLAQKALREEEENTPPINISPRQEPPTPALSSSPATPLPTRALSPLTPFASAATPDESTPEFAGRPFGVTQPHAPTKLGPIFRKESVFQKPIPQQINFAPYILNGLAHFTGAYKAPNGKTHYIIRQTRETSCGATSLLMLYTSQIPESSWGVKATDSGLSKKFWTQYASFGGTTLDQLEDFGNTKINLKAHKLRLIKIKNPKKHETADEAISFLKEQLSKIKQPVIFFLGNKEFSGHWIVIDQFDGDNFYIRDPYTAKAYEVSGKELFETATDYCVDLLSLEKAKREEGKAL